VRQTPDVDLGIDRRELGLSSTNSRIRPMLEAAEFEPGYGGEEFRFAKKVGPNQQTFVVDFLLAAGASRADPPILERGIRSLAAPGLAYALFRGPTEIDIRFATDLFRLPLVSLDSAFVMKAALVQSGARQRPDRRTTDTADAAMLTAACAEDADAVEALKTHRRRSDVKTAGRFLDKLARPAGAEARRVERHFAENGLDRGAEWAAAAARRLRESLGS
jgi:hypothetical protein